jgi:uncharacterized protein GlcG (DUF336 family)
MTLTLDHAKFLAEAAFARARARSMNVSVAVIDASFLLKAGFREDGAGPVTLEIAFGKARAALAFGCSSRQIADALAGNPLAGPSVLASLPKPVVLLPGGLVVRDSEGAVIGAIGVAGGAPDDDEWAAGSA